MTLKNARKPAVVAIPGHAMAKQIIKHGGSPFGFSGDLYVISADTTSYRNTHRLVEEKLDSHLPRVMSMDTKLGAFQIDPLFIILSPQSVIKAKGQLSIATRKTFRGAQDLLKRLAPRHPHLDVNNKAAVPSVTG